MALHHSCSQGVIHKLKVSLSHSQMLPLSPTFEAFFAEGELSSSRKDSIDSGSGILLFGEVALSPPTKKSPFTGFIPFEVGVAREDALPLTILGGVVEE